MRRWLATALCVLASGASAGDATAPEQVVRDFYRWEMDSGSHTEEGLSPARALLSRALFARLVEVARQETACARSVPADLKPFIIDGDPWYYYTQDGAKSLESTSLLVLKRGFSVAARLRYDDLAWTDTVDLTTEGDRWVIEDIRFEQGGSLTANLRTYLDEAKTECQ